MINRQKPHSTNRKYFVAGSLAGIVLVVTTIFGYYVPYDQQAQEKEALVKFFAGVAPITAVSFNLGNEQFKFVRATRDLLNTRGFNAQLTEIKGHTHDYYARSDEINKNAWDFLKKHELSVDPKYERYKWDNK